MKRSPKRGDASQAAWAVVQEATGQAATVETRAKNPEAVERGRAGGIARARALSAARRQEIAQSGVEARRKVG